MKLSHAMLATVASALISTAAVAAEQKSPIFGASAPKLTTSAENKATIGKGYYADYYGYYGYLYAYNSYYYAYYARYVTKNYNDYYQAYLYNGYATNNLYNAYYYQYYGL